MPNEFRPIPSDLLQIAFGIRHIGTYKGLESDNQNTTPVGSYSGLQVVSNDIEAERLSSMGTPVIFSMKFEGGEYNFYDKEGNIQSKRMETLELPVVAMADFRRAKNIQTTAINGGYGKVTEMFSFDNWVVTIRGICLNDDTRKNHKTAIEQKEVLHEWANLADSIRVIGSLFTIKSIYNIIIQEESYPAIAGRNQYFPFEFQCMSDMPIELVL